VSDSPLLTEKVVGYRGWYASGNNLYPVVAFGAWNPGVNTATCPSGRWLGAHTCPEPHSHCGLYAVHRPNGHYMTRTAPVKGAIAAWGKVQVHQDGFRAEHAEIVALVRPWTRSRRITVERAATAYGVPVVPKRKLRSEAAKHGTPVPKSLLPSPDKVSHLYALFSAFVAVMCALGTLGAVSNIVEGKAVLLFLFLGTLNAVLCWVNAHRVWRTWR
jgi:hypothetical protein